jgi:hypothetical protein
MVDPTLAIDPYEQIKRAYQMAGPAQQIAAAQFPVNRPTLAVAPPVPAKAAAVAAPNAPAPAAPTQLDTDQAALAKQKASHPALENVYGAITKSGFGQAHPIASKILGVLGQIPATALDVGLSGALPRYGQFIPGTSIQHGMRTAGLENEVSQDEANRFKEAQTANLNEQPVIRQQQLELNQEKQNEVEQHHQQQVATQLHALGYKMGDDNTIQPLSYDEMSPQQQGVHDLKASQQELADARSALAKAQKDNIPAAQEMAKQRISNAQRNAAIAAGRLGLSEREFEANYYGTDEKGNPLPGAPADEAGQPIGIKTAGITKPTATAQGRAAQGKAIIESANHLKNQIDDNKELFGNLGSYWNQAVNGTPISNPKAAKMMSELQSFAALQPALHGFRSHDAMREFTRLIGGIPKNPEALKASIDGLVESAATPMIHAGSVNTVRPKAGGTPAQSNVIVIKPEDMK